MALGKEVKVFQSVDAIGRDSINSIATDGFFTYERFKTLETQHVRAHLIFDRYNQ